MSAATAVTPTEQFVIDRDAITYQLLEQGVCLNRGDHQGAANAAAIAGTLTRAFEEKYGVPFGQAVWR